jgi:hypothetical protein
VSESIAQKKVEAPFEFRVGWNRDGIYFQGSSGLTVAVPAHVDVGPFTVESVTLGLTLQDAGFAIESSVSGHLALGPVVATVQRVGLNVNVSFEHGNIGISICRRTSAPSGIGLSIDGGGFKGGFSLRAGAARYSGMLELVPGSVHAQAFGLIETRLPTVRRASRS